MNNDLLMLNDLSPSLSLWSWLKFHEVPGVSNEQISRGGGTQALSSGRTPSSQRSCSVGSLVHCGYSEATLVSVLGVMLNFCVCECMCFAMARSDKNTDERFLGSK